jgi:hypothetical protein
MPLPRSKTSSARFGMALACALAVWLLGLFASSAQLHEALHEDAAHGGHSCAITLFNDGVEDPVCSNGFTVAPAVLPLGKIVAVTIAAPADTGVRLPPGCGPPSC